MNAIEVTVRHLVDEKVVASKTARADYDWDELPPDFVELIATTVKEAAHQATSAFGEYVRERLER